MQPVFRFLMIAGATAAVVVMPFCASRATAQVDLQGSWRTRLESWDWFEAPGHDHRYTYGHSLLRLSASGQNRKGQWVAEVAQPMFVDLPRNAVAPPPAGQLGFGGTLRAVNGSAEADLFLKQLSYEWAVPGGRLKAGRFEFADGQEVTVQDPGLKWLHQARINERLIGPFGFSPVQRSFDGVRLRIGTPQRNTVLFAAYPTAGAFERDGNRALTRVHVAYLAHSRAAETETSGRDRRAFVMWYRDARTAAPKADNRPATARQADREAIRLVTLGGHWAQVWKQPSGRTDVLLWGAVQSGDWGSLDHSGYALAAEAGRQFSTPWKPWVRAGYYRGSGDRDPGDGKHTTFMPATFTPRPYALTPFYNTMNLDDRFVQVLLTPGPKWSVRADYHRLRLDRSQDLWYAGGGPFDNKSFGIAGRPSGGKRTLASVVDVTLNHRVSDRLQLSLYRSLISGGDVVGAVYPAGKNGGLFFVESGYRF